MMRLALSFSPLLGLAVALTGCVRSQASMSAMPSTLHVQQICPGATYELVGEFEQGWSGWGFLGFPFSAGPNVAEFVNSEVARLRGDAAMDVMLRTDFRMRLLFVYITALPGYIVSGKVIRYTDTSCFPSEAFRPEQLPPDDLPSTTGGPHEST